MFYDANYHNSLLDKQWKIFLDSKLIQKDFWMKYKHSVGNQQVCIELSLLLSGISSVSLSCLNYMYHKTKDAEFWNMIDGSVVSIPLTLLIFICYYYLLQ